MGWDRMGWDGHFRVSSSSAGGRECGRGSHFWDSLSGR